MRIIAGPRQHRRGNGRCEVRRAVRDGAPRAELVASVQHVEGGGMTVGVRGAF
jgi:hypothetical protein